MALPTFVVIGAMKAGTTSLHEYLAAHPQVCMSVEKEPNFFTLEHNWDRGVSWYEAQFAAGEDAVAVGEVSPSYTLDGLFAPGVPERMHSVVPDARLVYLLRHPIERMRSSWVQNISDAAWENRPIREALADPTYYTVGSSYGRQLARYLEVFERDRVLVVTSEELRDHRDTTLRTILRFIGVDEHLAPTATAAEHNRGDDKPVLPPAVLRLRQQKGFQVAKRLVPLPVRNLVRRRATRPATQLDQAIPPELEAVLVERLQPDLQLLRSIVGAGFDCWGLAP